MKILFFCFQLLFSFHSFCQYEAIKPKGIYSSNFIIDEKPRNITYYMPAAYGKREAYPLLIVFHAEKSDAATTIKKYGDLIQEKADSAGCIVLFPDAYKGHWNSDLKDSVNDVGFLNIMAEFFLRQFDCDLSELRLLGLGNGGNLCYRFTCASVHKPIALATINATVSNDNFPGCQNAKSLRELNIISATASKTDIEHALAYLFSIKK